MFAGCSYTWYLFSEGGPWTAYYPSKSNSLCPAKDKDEAYNMRTSFKQRYAYVLS